MKKLPKGINLRNTWRLARQLPMMKLYKMGKHFEKDPEGAVSDYKRIAREDMARLKEIELRGYDKAKGLAAYSQELFECLKPSCEQEMAVLFGSVLGTYSAVDSKRVTAETEELREEYDSLCSGFEGDELMEINIAVNHLANKLDSHIWQQYDHDNLAELAERVEMNLSGVLSDLPADFISEWTVFLEKYGWDRGEFGTY